MRSVKLGFVAAALLLGSTALSSPAFAGNEGGCHKDCYTPPQGGDIDNSNWSKNENNNWNKNENENNNWNKNENNNWNSNYNKQHQSQQQQQQQKQYQDQDQHQHQEVNDSGNSSVEINNERPPVSTAYSAALATSEDTCMGSSSIGGQGVGFGLTIGTTWTDDNCRRLKNSRQLVALGYHRAGTALMCMDEDVRNAMIQAGTPCPSGQAYVAPAIYVPPPAPAREYVPMAPVPDRPVRHRRHKKALPPK